MIRIPAKADLDIWQNISHRNFLVFKISFIFAVPSGNG